VNVFSCDIVPPDDALNNADFCTAVCVADDVKVCRMVVLFVPPVCDFVVASALFRPPVVISPEPALKFVSVAAGAVESADNAIKPEPLVPAPVLV